MPTPVTLAVEGPTDEAVAKRLLREFHLEAGPIYGGNGKQDLDRRLPGFNHAARLSCWLVLRDLDRDADCPAELRRRLLPDAAGRMRLHFAVRAVEAWLLADAEGMARFLSVSRAGFPENPEGLRDPKAALLDLARRSRCREIRAGMVPAPETTARIDPAYTALLIDYAARHWRPTIAAERSPSLARLMAFLRRARERGSRGR